MFLFCVHHQVCSPSYFCAIFGDFGRPSVLSTVQPSCSAVSMLPSETGIEKGSDEHSKGSTTSISSGFSSLNRKGLLDGQAPGMLRLWIIAHYG